MIRTQVYLPKDLHRGIRLHAKQEGRPASVVIREILQEGLRNKTKHANAGTALLRLAKHAVRGLPKDLSTNLDKYLYED